MAGLVSAIRLSRAGFHCTLAEKKTYPFHRVCGEYISNETTDFLKRENIFPESFRPPQINQFKLSNTSGKTVKIPLVLGGFGISRYAFDNFLYQKALETGATCLLDSEVTEVKYEENSFCIKTSQKDYNADFVIGSMGKRSKLDVVLQRDYINMKSPFAAVKYHLRSDHPQNEIALHNFPGGYCGINNIEDQKSNLCYLIHRDLLRQTGNVKATEEKYLSKNPRLKEIFTSSKFLSDQPETISEVSFVTKEPVWNHIFMIGDSAGMIAPLCGNGMAMAIHSAKMLSDLLIDNRNNLKDRTKIEMAYTKNWNKNFSKRLYWGRLIQNQLFGNRISSNLAIGLAVNMPSFANLIIRATHGKPI